MQEKIVASPLFPTREILLRFCIWPLFNGNIYENIFAAVFANLFTSIFSEIIRLLIIYLTSRDGNCKIKQVCMFIA